VFQWQRGACIHRPQLLSRESRSPATLRYSADPSEDLTMSAPQLQTLEFGPRQHARASIIWLHGLGADGHDFEPIVPALGLPDTVRFVFPHAPVRPVTVNGGIPMRAWYDISGFGETRVEDEAGIRDSAEHLQRLIEREATYGIDADRVVLAGFSQGGAVALHTGLRHRTPLAGILALSTYLPLAAALESEHSTAAKNCPIFMAHGRLDQVVPLAVGERSRDHLRQLGQAVEWHEYPVEHTVSMPEIRDIAAWLRRIFALG
jgi:phospholipase/carboxylesterase